MRPGAKWRAAWRTKSRIRSRPSSCPPNACGAAISHQMTGEDAQILDRATYTIVQQVEAMKAMVNAFSEYARAPDMKVTKFPLNALVTEVADLHRVQESGVKIDVDLDPHIENVEADRGRVRQILNNLIVNGAEAVENTPGGHVVAATRLETVGSRRIRHDHRNRQRAGLFARGIGARVRSLCHQQAQGHGIGARDRQKDCRRARRARGGRQSAGRRRARACILARNRRIPTDGCARTAR